MNGDAGLNPSPHLQGLLCLRWWWAGLLHSALYQPQARRGLSRAALSPRRSFSPPRPSFHPFLLSWLHTVTHTADSVLDASSPGEFSTKHGDLSHPTENAAFLDGSLFMHEKTWHWPSGSLFSLFCLILFCASEIEQLKSRLLLKASALPTARL